MNLAGRDSTKIVHALTQKRHYVAATNMMRRSGHPLDLLGRYLFGTGDYPASVSLKTPIGPLALTLWCQDDVLTVNEIFFRNDYASDEHDRIFVDFGSNIGISAAYFLSRNRAAYAYLFEPLRRNTRRLATNLAEFRGRYTLQETAVGLRDGDVEFGCEDTGRYGGVGLQTGRYVQVPCRDSNAVLAEVIRRHGHIDVLKIDIETLEREVTERIPEHLARCIGKIYVEYCFTSNPLADTHEMSHYGEIACFVNRTWPAAPRGRL